jgi:hypothetical protein
MVVTEAVSQEEREEDECDSSSAVEAVVIIVGMLDEVSIDRDTEGADAILAWSDAEQPSSRGGSDRASDVSSGSSKKVAMIARVRHDWMKGPPRPCSIGG